MFTVTSDTSLTGWGGACGVSSSGGLWSRSEKNVLHINFLELKRAFFVLSDFCKDVAGSHLLFMSDNSTACACINNMGSKKESYNNTVQDTWLCCLEQDHFISAVRLPGMDNVIADCGSRANKRGLE